jgi:uncharacterized protein
MTTIAAGDVARRRDGFHSFFQAKGVCGVKKSWLAGHDGATMPIMRSVILLVVYLLSVFLAGALLAPWLLWGVSSLAEIWPGLAGLADHPFYRYVHRSLLIVAVLGLWPLLRVAGMASRVGLGLRCSPGGLMRFGVGLAIGLVVMSGVGLLMVLFGVREWDLSRVGDLGELMAVVRRAGSTALAVGLLEEVLFRGVVFGLLLKSLRPGVALVSSSLLFAAVHLLGRPAAPDEIGWGSGLMIVGEMLLGLADGPTWLPAGVTLAIFGVLLGACYQRTGDLLFSIGLHAGLVFSVRFYGRLTSGVPDSALWFWGSRQWLDGWMAALVMLLLWWISEQVIRRFHGGVPPEKRETE